MNGNTISKTISAPSDLTEIVESLRIEAARKIDGRKKSKLGQFFTPSPVARLMASMAECREDTIRIMDAGAGVGSLFAALVADLCGRKRQPRRIEVTAFELEGELCEYLGDTMRMCEGLCREVGIGFSGEVEEGDFLEYAVDALGGGLFGRKTPSFNCAILNPPYFKIQTGSKARKLIREIGVETSNIYTGFLAAVVRLLAVNGELIAITPRSFCNGPYFRPFREFFLGNVVLRRLHLFESRSQAFRGDEVLQENLIFHAKKSGRIPKTVEITSNGGPHDEVVASRQAPYGQVARPNDPDSVIHIAVDELADRVAETYSHFQSSLEDLGINVSTGRVVDFRAREALRPDPGEDTVPLIYPTHFEKGYVSWPKPGSKKPNAIVAADWTASLLVPNEYYVLVKRFSAKEEPRRVVAAVYDPGRFECEAVGFENHLNYFHQNGAGLDKDIAKGLAAFLNSTLLDSYFRQFSGHTQVNATDLRAMRYPTTDELRSLGESIPGRFREQRDLDALVHEKLLEHAAEHDPVETMKRIDEALQILKDLGLPREQVNERSALSLLALLDVKPKTAWANASSPLCGITQMMDYFAEHYGKKYRPNTRESVRRQTIHQFLDAGLIVANFDRPDRPINSPQTVYQIEPDALTLIQTFGTKSWNRNLRRYLTSVETLRKAIRRIRDLKGV